MNDRLAAFTPLLIVALALVGGLMLFVYFTPNASAPTSNAAPSPKNPGPYADSRYNAYNDIYNEHTYRRLTTGVPSALGYALYISCVEYNSQLACNQFDLLQTRGEEMERR